MNMKIWLKEFLCFGKRVHLKRVNPRAHIFEKLL